MCLECSCLEMEMSLLFHVPNVLKDESGDSTLLKEMLVQKGQKLREQGKVRSDQDVWL